MPELFHVREKHLPPGTLIQPGRWGETVLQDGGKHPYFFREHLLEMWRLYRTSVSVSRFNCTFAFETREEAVRYATCGHEAILTVEPVDLNSHQAKLDMMWLQWMRNPGTTTKQIENLCNGYWQGKPLSDYSAQVKQPFWERLYPCALRVV